MTLSAETDVPRGLQDTTGHSVPPFFFFLHFFIFLFLLPFYPAHPCGTVNVSQGLPATQTVTKWNGRKNEWKTIKEGPRTGREEGELLRWLKKEGGEGEKTEGRPPTGLIKSITFFSLAFRSSDQFFSFLRSSSSVDSFRDCSSVSAILFHVLRILDPRKFRSHLFP